VVLKIGDRTRARQSNVKTTGGGGYLPRCFNRSEHFEQDFDFLEALDDPGVAIQPLTQRLRLRMFSFQNQRALRAAQQSDPRRNFYVELLQLRCRIC